MKEQVAEIVAAYLERNRVDASELPALIVRVSQSLGALSTAPTPVSVTLIPAVPIRRSGAASQRRRSPASTAAKSPKC
jgi:predicted transcriptional regulator